MIFHLVFSLIFRWTLSAISAQVASPDLWSINAKERKQILHLLEVSTVETRDDQSNAIAFLTACIRGVYSSSIIMSFETLALAASIMRLDLRNKK